MDAPASTACGMGIDDIDSELHAMSGAGPDLGNRLSPQAPGGLGWAGAPRPGMRQTTGDEYKGLPVDCHLSQWGRDVAPSTMIADAGPQDSPLPARRRSPDMGPRARPFRARSSSSQRHAGQGAGGGERQNPSTQWRRADAYRIRRGAVDGRCFEGRDCDADHNVWPR